MVLDVVWSGGIGDDGFDGVACEWVEHFLGEGEGEVAGAAGEGLFGWVVDVDVGGEVFCCGYDDTEMFGAL